MLTLLALACAPDDSFYTDPVPGLAEYAPGDVVRLERIGHTSALSLGLKASTSSPHGAEIYRILYRTVGLTGEPDVGSARLAIPDDVGPAPVMAHLHGTTGLADRCAPSRDPGFGFESAGNPAPARMLARGAVVVEPDYLGLGPPGPHPYTAAVPTGQSVLDAIRAAQRFSDPERDVETGEAPFVLLEGHSQGGHAVLATLASAATYAPELPIRAAVAIAAPGAPRDLLETLVAEDRWGGFAAMAMVGWSSAHPEVGPPEDLVTEDLLEDFDEDCLVGLGGAVDGPPSELLVSGAVDGLPDEVFALEDLGGLSTATELLLVHGTRDDLLPIDLTEAYADRIAAAGTPVTFVPIDGGDHLLLPWTARDVVLSFLEDALD